MIVYGGVAVSGFCLRLATGFEEIAIR